MKNIPYIKNFEQWKENFEFYTTIRVRFSETDMFGHMNNVSAFIYFEQARIEFLQHVGFTLEEDGNQGIPIVADLQCDYLKQIFFNDKIKLYVKAHHIGTTSFDLHYKALNEKNEVCLTGRGTLVYIHSKTHQPIPIPKDKIKALQSNS